MRLRTLSAIDTGLAGWPLPALDRHLPARVATWMPPVAARHGGPSRE